MSNPTNLKEAMQLLATEVKAKLDTKAESTVLADYVTSETLGTTLQDYLTEDGAAEAYQPKAGTGEGEAYATQGYVTTAIEGKANSADVYGKTDVYTKTEVDNLIGALPTETEIKGWIADAINNGGN